MLERLKSWFGGDGPKDGPAPRPAAMSVRCDDGGIHAAFADGKSWTIGWDELERVVIRTTDQGPFVDDVIWMLQTPRGVYGVPQGVEGDAALLERLQALPGFDNQAVISAMMSTDNAVFPCWSSGGGDAPPPA